MKIRSPFALLAAGALAFTLTGCADDAPDEDSSGAEEVDGAVVSEDRDPDEGSAEDDSEDDSAGEDGPADAGTADLFADLHDLDIPELGTAWIEVDGTQVEFGDAQCELKESENGETFTAGAHVESDEIGPVEITLKRIAGDGKRQPFESDEIQLTFIGGTEFREKNGISLLQHSRYHDSDDWLSGEGESPAIRTDGETVTAVGVLERMPMSEDPLEGDFTLALNCG